MTDTQYTSVRATGMSSIVPSISLCSSDVLEAPLVSMCSKLLVLIFLYYFLSCGGGTWGSRLHLFSSCRQFGRRSHHSRVFLLSDHSLLPLLLLTLAYKVLGFTLAFSNKIGFYSVSQTHLVPFLPCSLLCFQDNRLAFSLTPFLSTSLPQSTTSFLPTGSIHFPSAHKHIYIKSSILLWERTHDCF